MFPEPTVFVLGAGASADFGFPTGISLNQSIINWVRTENARQELDRISNVSFRQMKALGTALDVAQISIDRWLTQNSEFLNIGRYGIARFIAEEESHNKYIWQHWYARLWRSLMPPVPCKDWPKRLLENRVSFITFNYDRSLEHCLMNKIISTYQTTVELAAEVISNLRILHVYGQIGRLPWQLEKGRLQGLSPREYGELIDPDEPSVGLEIKIIVEVPREDEVFQTARQWLLESKHTHFLGFAYYPENLDRLKFGTGIQRRGGFTGTHQGLSDRRIHDLQTTGAEFGIPIEFTDGPGDIDSYFSKHIEG